MGINVSFVNSSKRWGYFVVSQDNETYKFPCNTKSNEVFNADSRGLIRGKCVGLLVLTPLVTTGRLIVEVAKLIFNFFASLYFLCRCRKVPKPYNPIRNLGECFRVVGYGAGMMGSALVGIANPYWGRQKYGSLERRLNRHPDGPHEDKCYSAFCFQRLIVLERPKGKLDITKISNIDEVKRKFGAHLSAIL